jgi:heme ABC exporter ATP-binding subunit CcmA
MQAIVQTRDLARRYGARWALARVDLDVAEGERLLIVGPNGCGKTTLLRILATLEPPSKGSLKLFGQDVQRNPGAVRSELALLGHEPGVYEDLSAAENLEVLAACAGRPPPDVDQALQVAGLENRPDPVRKLSAGMRRRLALAVLWNQQPRLALLDEPFAQLDPGGIARVGEAIARLPGSVIFASHQVRHAAPLCDRAILLDEGQIRWSGAADQAEAAWRALHRERGQL